MELQLTTNLFESLANPLFDDSYLDDTQITDHSLLVLPVIRPKQKRVRWLDEDEGLPLVELFTYFGNWDRTPIQVSYIPRGSSSKQQELMGRRSRVLLYFCMAFCFALVCVLG